MRLVGGLELPFIPSLTVRLVVGLELPFIPSLVRRRGAFITSMTQIASRANDSLPPPGSFLVQSTRACLFQRSLTMPRRGGRSIFGSPMPLQARGGRRLPILQTATMAESSLEHLVMSVLFLLLLGPPQVGPLKGGFSDQTHILGCESREE
jgi:hypothetical protein